MGGDHAEVTGWPKYRNGRISHSIGSHPGHHPHPNQRQYGRYQLPQRTAQHYGHQYSKGRQRLATCNAAIKTTIVQGNCGDMNTYETAMYDSSKGVIRGIPIEEAQGTLKTTP